MKQENLLKNTSFLGGGHKLTLPKCMMCDNFTEDKKDNIMRCKAFPDGIPKDILWESEEKECNKGIKYKFYI